MKINIHTPSGLIPISPEVTKQTIIEALGYTPANQAAYDSIDATDDTTFYIIDSQQHILAKVDADGLHAAIMTVNGKDVESGLIYDIKELDDSAFYIVDKDQNVICRIDENGLTTTAIAATYIHALIIHTDNLETEESELYIADKDNKPIFKVGANGVETTHVVAADAILSQHSVVGHIEDNIRHVTEAEKAIWHSKSKIDSISEDVDSVLLVLDKNDKPIVRIDESGITTTTVISNDTLVAGNSTLGHIENANIHIQDGERDIWNSVINKASKLDLEQHINDSEKHLQEGERVYWNQKVDTISDDSDFIIVDSKNNKILEVNSEGVNAGNLKIRDLQVATIVDVNTQVQYLKDTKLDTEVFNATKISLENAISDLDQTKTEISDFNSHVTNNDIHLGDEITVEDDTTLYVKDSEGEVIAQFGETGVIVGQLTASNIVLQNETLSDTLTDLSNDITTAKNEAIAIAANDATTKANTAESNAKNHADGLNNSMNTRVANLEKIDHDAYKAADNTLKKSLEDYADLAKADAKSHADSLNLAMDSRVKANTKAIETLNGTEEGSVSFKINAAFNDFATKMSNDEVVNTYKELIDYAADHGAEFTALVGEVSKKAEKEVLNNHMSDDTRHIGDEIKLEDNNTLYIVDKDDKIIAQFDSTGFNAGAIFHKYNPVVSGVIINPEATKPSITEEGVLVLPPDKNDIPGNGKITVKLGDTEIQSFYVNQKTPTEITIPNNLNSFVNDSGFTTNEGTVKSVSLSVPTGFKTTVGTVNGEGGTLTFDFDEKYELHTSDQAALWTGKLNKISDLETIRSNADLGKLAYFWGNHADFGYLTDETEFNASPARRITDKNIEDWTNKQDAITDLDAIRTAALQKQGTVTEIKVGTGLTGGTITDSGTIAVDTVNYKLPTKNEWDAVTGVTEGVIGTVSSVGLSMPEAFDVSNTPITTTGTFNVSLKSGYVIPTAKDKDNWDAPVDWADITGIPPVTNGDSVDGVKNGIPSVNGDYTETPLTFSVGGKDLDSIIVSAKNGSDFKYEDFTLEQLAALKGFSPTHSWDGTKLTFTDINGSGTAVDLKGEKGDPGTSVTIKGTKASTDDLPEDSLTNPNVNGDGYIVNGYLYVWDGNSWENVGEIKGPKGDPGDNGTSAKIIGATAKIDNNVGLPSVEVTLGGTEFNRTFAFDFKNLKGLPGNPGDPGDSITKVISVLGDSDKEGYTLNTVSFYRGEAEELVNTIPVYSKNGEDIDSSLYLPLSGNKNMTGGITFDSRYGDFSILNLFDIEQNLNYPIVSYLYGDRKFVFNGIADASNLLIGDITSDDKVLQVVDSLDHIVTLLDRNGITTTTLSADHIKISGGTDDYVLLAGGGYTPLQSITEGLATEAFVLDKIAKASLGGGDSSVLDGLATIYDLENLEDRINESLKQYLPRTGGVLTGDVDLSNSSILFDGGQTASISCILDGLLINSSDCSFKFAGRADFNTSVYATKFVKKDGTANQVLLANGATKAISTFSDTYPTAFKWNNGTTAGPTGTLSTNNRIITLPFDAIPSASNVQSGIVTIGPQSFAGNKTLSNESTFTIAKTGPGGDNWSQNIEYPYTNRAFVIGQDVDKSLKLLFTRFGLQAWDAASDELDRDIPSLYIQGAGGSTIFGGPIRSKYSELLLVGNDSVTINTSDGLVTIEDSAIKITKTGSNSSTVISNKTIDELNIVQKSYSLNNVSWNNTLLDEGYIADIVTILNQSITNVVPGTYTVEFKDISIRNLVSTPENSYGEAVVNSLILHINGRSYTLLDKPVIDSTTESANHYIGSFKKEIKLTTSDVNIQVQVGYSLLLKNKPSNNSDFNSAVSVSLSNMSIIGNDTITVVAKDGIVFLNGSETSFKLGIGTNSTLILNNLPTSPTNLLAGSLYNSSGTIKIVL